MKLYQNRQWLFDRYCVKRMSIDEIAVEASCGRQTIYNYIKKFGLG